MLFYGSIDEGVAYLEASGEAWARYADAIFLAHGGQHPDDPPADDTAS